MRDVDSIEGMLEIGRPNTESVESQRNARPVPQGAAKKRDSTKYLAQTRRKNDLGRKRHPVGRNLNKLVRSKKVSDACYEEKRGQQPPHDRSEEIEAVRPGNPHYSI